MVTSQLGLFSAASAQLAQDGRVGLSGEQLEVWDTGSVLCASWLRSSQPQAALGNAK